MCMCVCVCVCVRACAMAVNHGDVFHVGISFTLKKVTGATWRVVRVDVFESLGDLTMI